MEEKNLKTIIANNLQYYRKSLNLTQADVADAINYSDKSVSKWERGDGLPDIEVLSKLAELFNVTINDLVYPKKSGSRLQNFTRSKYFVTILSTLIVWLIAVTTFVLLGIFLPEIKESWLAFIYAIPISSIVVLILSSVWGNRLIWTISTSFLIWSAGLALYLTFPTVSNIWLCFLIAIPLQVMAIVWFIYRNHNEKEKK